VHRYLNKKGLRPKRYKRSNPQRKPTRCCHKFTPTRKCKNPASWMVKPIYRPSRYETLAKPTCRYHIVNVLNRFKSLKIEITRARKCKNPGQWMVKPIYRASRHTPPARPACRNHIAQVLNRFKSDKFTVTRVPQWISAKQWEEEVKDGL